MNLLTRHNNPKWNYSYVPCYTHEGNTGDVENSNRKPRNSHSAAGRWAEMCIPEDVFWVPVLCVYSKAL